MNIAIWIVQILLAFMFGMAGVMKLTQPKEKLMERMKWVDGISLSTVKLIGGLDLLGAIGVILPRLTGILPWLTPLAAIGLAIIMISAIVVHVRRGEANLIGLNIGLLVLAIAVAYVRFAIPAAV